MEIQRVFVLFLVCSAVGRAWAWCDLSTTAMCDDLCSRELRKDVAREIILTSDVADFSCVEDLQRLKIIVLAEPQTTCKGDVPKGVTLNGEPCGKQKQYTKNIKKDQSRGQQTARREDQGLPSHVTHTTVTTERQVTKPRTDITKSETKTKTQSSTPRMVSVKQEHRSKKQEIMPSVEPFYKNNTLKTELIILKKPETKLIRTTPIPILSLLMPPTTTVRSITHHQTTTKRAEVENTLLVETTTRKVSSIITTKLIELMQTTTPTTLGTTFATVESTTQPSFPSTVADTSSDSTFPSYPTTKVIFQSNRTSGEGENYWTTAEITIITTSSSAAVIIAVLIIGAVAYLKHRLSQNQRRRTRGAVVNQFTAASSSSTGGGSRRSSEGGASWSAQGTPKGNRRGNSTKRQAPPIPSRTSTPMHRQAAETLALPSPPFGLDESTLEDIELTERDELLSALDEISARLGVQETEV